MHPVTFSSYFGANFVAVLVTGQISGHSLVGESSMPALS